MGVKESLVTNWSHGFHKVCVNTGSRFRIEQYSHFFSLAFHSKAFKPNSRMLYY